MPVPNPAAGDLDWSADVPSGAEGLSIATAKIVGAGTIRLSADENTTGATRSGAILVSAGDALGSPAEITVNQGAAGTPVLRGDLAAAGWAAVMAAKGPAAVHR